MSISTCAIHTRLSLSVGAGLLLLVGCSHETETNSPVSTPASSTAEAHHEHPSEGPHHGELVELGNEEYHLEIVHDDVTGAVTAYVLDSSAKQAAPIDAPEIIVNLHHNGEAEQFSLSASPQSSDPPKKSSRFVSNDAELSADLESDAVEAQTVVTINDKQFRGPIKHNHESHESQESHENTPHEEHDRN